MEAFDSRTNEQIQAMEFQEILLKVEQNLNRDDVEALVFLCADLLGKDVRCISTGKELFSHLQELDLLSPERPFLLVELLRMSRRIGLLRQLNLLHLVPEGLVSPYRKMLFDLSENITASDLKNIKFLLHKTLPRRKLEDDLTMLNLLLEMEKEDHLSNMNLETLEKIIVPVCPNLRKKIIQYKEECVNQRTGVWYVNASQAQPEEPSAQCYLLQPSKGASSYESPATSGCVQEHGDQYELRREEHMSPSHYLHLQPHASSQEPCSLSSQLSSILPGSLETPDARMEGMSLSQMGDSGKSDSTFSSVQSNIVHFTSSCGEKNLCGAEPFPGQQLEMETYEMSEGRTRGVCLIINNFDFSQSPLKNREGTDTDVECLVKVFEWLGFQTRTERDCSRERMRSVLALLGEEDHARTDCLAVCVLSHGDRGVVCCVDGGELSLRDLTLPFSGARCASLVGKPKLFFVQACQGKKEQQAVAIQSDGPDLTTDAFVPQDSIPDEADFLLSMATVPEFASFRHKKEGTWFIQSLCENLVRLVPSGYDLLSILTKVNSHVSGMTARISGVNKKQMPQPAFSLRKRIVFPVPRQPPPKLKEQTSP